MPGRSPLFSFGKNDFHSRFSLVRLLNLCLVDARLSLSDYSWHSFRRGAAVFAFKLGLSDSAVQLLGDWSSAPSRTILSSLLLGRQILLGHWPPTVTNNWRKMNVINCFSLFIMIKKCV